MWSRFVRSPRCGCTMSRSEFFLSVRGSTLLNTPWMRRSSSEGLVVAGGGAGAGSSARTKAAPRSTTAYTEKRMTRVTVMRGRRRRLVRSGVGRDCGLLRRLLFAELRVTGEFIRRERLVQVVFVEIARALVKADGFE